jgi:hypothetical protein
MVGKLGVGNGWKIQREHGPKTGSRILLPRQRLDGDESAILSPDTIHLRMVAQTDKLPTLRGWVVCQ